MKKLFLLLAFGISCASVNAQESNSIVFTHQAQLSPNIHAHPMPARVHQRNLPNNSNSRTTGLLHYNDWFDYWDENFVSASTSAGYYFEVYPDSNLYNPADLSGGGDGYLYVHGLGMSFDPTDLYYYAAAADGIGDPPILQTTDSSTAYAIDSFYVVGKYMRNNPNASIVDSLIIDLIATSPSGTGYDSGVALLQFNSDPSFVVVTADSTPRFASALYTGADFVASPQPLISETWDSITVVQKQRYAIPLNAAFFADTDANGDNIVDMALTQGNLQVAAGMKVVSFVSFKSGVHYPFGANVDTSNYYWLYAGDPGGATVFIPQTPHNSATGYLGSYQDGLIAQNQIAYDGHGANSFTYAGHPLLIPAEAFISATQESPVGFEVPEQAFHVLWSSEALGVTNVNKLITTVNAYPNPAANELNISFNVANAAAVSVSLTNVLGQTIATQNMGNVTNGKAVFNTAALPDGMYIYTLQANGERTTGHVVVAH